MRTVSWVPWALSLAAAVAAASDRDDEGRKPCSSASLPEARAVAISRDARYAGVGDLEAFHVLVSGLTLLRWLIDRQQVGGHLSVVPVSGAGPNDVPPRFDQQPIEVAAIADACARAESVTGDAEWRHGVDLAIAWFEGDNDAMTPMSDALTGGGFDGLTASGPNRNQGAESTLALISTMQYRESNRHRPKHRPM